MITFIVLEFFAVFNLEDDAVDGDVADLVFDLLLEAADDDISLRDFSTLEEFLCSWDDSSVKDDDIATVSKELTTVFS